MTADVKAFAIMVVAAAIGTLIAELLVNKNRTVRRAVGGI